MNGKFSIILFFFLCLKVAFASNDLRVVASDNSSIVIEYIPQYVDTSLIKKKGVQYRAVQLLNGSSSTEMDELYSPLPYRLINVGVPAEYGNIIQIISTQSSKLAGKLDFNSSPENNYDKGQDNSQAQISSIDKELVTFDEYGLSRDLQIQTIRINPVKYNSDNSEITLYTKIVFRISFGSVSKEFSQVSDKRLSKSVVNFKEASKWGEKKKSLRKTQNNSVLENGIWFRFEAPEEGIYRIDRSQMSSLGIDPAQVNPSTIKIFNNGGKILPAIVADDAPSDLVENAIVVVGEEDGNFDEGDYILFYGRGVNFWEYDDNTDEIVRRRNYYSKFNYYWITSGGSNGKRMQNQISSEGAVDIEQSNTQAYLHLEDDLYNVGKSGLDYWGDELTPVKTPLTYINTLEGYISNTPVEYNFRFANLSSSSGNLSVSVNDMQIYNRTLFGYGSAPYRWGTSFFNSASFQGQIPDERSVLKFSLSSSSSAVNFRIDYYEIEYLRDLKAQSDQLIFYAAEDGSKINYNLSNFSNSNIRVFNVSDYDDVKIIEGSKISGGECSFQADDNIGIRSKYIALTTSSFKTIINIEATQNTNIKGISPGAEYLIITDRLFTDQADRLKNYRSSEAPNKLRSEVVYVDQIMDEFSGGSLDPTAIRNFLKYAYNNWEVKPFYVLFFGDGDYDYFNLEGHGTNFVPTYQTSQSLDELRSFPYDDFFSRIVGTDVKADLALGRVTVSTVDQAESYVDKIITYETLLEKSTWRTNVTLVADDGWTPSGDDRAIHTRQAERLATNYIPDYMTKEKIFLSKYETTITGLGRRKPSVNEAIISAVNNGTSILNYTGHGSPNVWADERVFQRTVSIPRFDNDKFYFLTAATCDFGRYDDPNIVSGTEDMLLLNGRGMIGGFSAARLVYANENAAINEEFYTNLFSNPGTVPVGDAYLVTKQKKTQTNDEKFHLFCDPALVLNLPSVPVNIDKINDEDLSVDVQLKALGEVSVKGSVQNSSGTIDNGFNGEGIITVFDSERDLYLEDISYLIKEQGGVIFKGRVSITNGRFETDFRVPKDITYENKNGRVIAYVFDEDQDGIGYTNSVIVGGTDENAVDDGEGPEIEISFDDESFTNAYLVNPNFDLIVKLNDETGLNTTGTGVGHRLEGVFDDDIENSIDLSNYFVGDIDAGGKSGVANYKFSNAAIGDHKIFVKAWDVFNNPTSFETYFTVVNADEAVVRDVVNYPNPFSGNTTFTFQHNLTDMIDVRIKVYTIAGRLVKEIESYSIIDRFVKIDWDGRDEDGDELANGTYLYKVIIKSNDGELNKSVLGKLAVFH